MSRAKKILIVGFVFAVGIGLAWPFRKTVTEVESTYSADSQQFTAVEKQFHNTRPALQNSVRNTTVKPSKRNVVAKMASTGEYASSTDRKAVVRWSDNDSRRSDSIGPTPLERTERPTVVSSEARPAYSTANRATNQENVSEWPKEILYVVHNGDTLEKLAKRYLGDASRALEIFDINRDQLTNPHLLPIGAELRVPVETNAPVQ